MSEGHGKPCYYCGKLCNDLAGNPGEWGIPLCHRDEPGKVKWHHTSCVAERLIENQPQYVPSGPRPMATAPKDSNGVLAYSPKFYQGQGGWVAAVWIKDSWHSNPGGWRFSPTHWMPLPERPSPISGSGR